jgi:hypothetical protein
MNLGKVPVVQSGQLGIFDRQLSPVPAGHVLVLSGSAGAIELPVGTRTDFDLRRRYPSFALVSLTPCEVEFSQTYLTSDSSYGYKVVMRANVQVARAADFVRIYGVETAVGTPLVDHWKVRIGELVNRYGRDGLAELQRFVSKMLTSMRDLIAEEAPVFGGIRLLGCTFDIHETPQSVVLRELQAYGRDAAPGLKIRFPHMSGEIDRWVNSHKSYVTDDREERRAKIEEIDHRLNAQLNWAERMIRIGIVDPDEVPSMLDPGMRGNDGKFKLLDTTDKSEPKRIGREKIEEEEDEE